MLTSMISGSDVRAFIDPVDPDHVSCNPAGQWLLHFEEPVRDLDLVVIRRIDGIAIRREYRNEIGQGRVPHYFIEFDFERHVWQCARCHKLMTSEAAAMSRTREMCCSAACASPKV